MSNIEHSRPLNMLILICSAKTFSLPAQYNFIYSPLKSPPRSEPYTSRLLSSPPWGERLGSGTIGSPRITATAFYRSFLVSLRPLPGLFHAAAVLVLRWKPEYFGSLLKTVQWLPTALGIRYKLPSVAGKAPPKRYLMPCFPLCASLPGLFSYPLMHPSLHCLSAPGWKALHHFRGPPCSPFSEDLPSPARAAFFPLLAAFIPNGNTLSLPFCPCPPFRV